MKPMYRGKVALARVSIVVHKSGLVTLVPRQTERPAPKVRPWAALAWFLVALLAALTLWSRS